MTINALDAGDEPRMARQFDGWLRKPVPVHHRGTAALARVSLGGARP
jgi:hypothetical protein